MEQKEIKYNDIIENIFLTLTVGSEKTFDINTDEYIEITFIIQDIIFYPDKVDEKYKHFVNNENVIKVRNFFDEFFNSELKNKDELKAEIEVEKNDPNRQFTLRRYLINYYDMISEFKNAKKLLIKFLGDSLLIDSTLTAKLNDSEYPFYDNLKELFRLLIAEVNIYKEILAVFRNTEYNQELSIQMLNYLKFSNTNFSNTPKKKLINKLICELYGHTPSLYSFILDDFSASTETINDKINIVDDLLFILMYKLRKE